MSRPMLVRKIARENWPSSGNGKSYLDVNGDVFSTCLKSEGNCLSLWLVCSEAEIVDAVIAFWLSRDQRISDLTEVVLVPVDSMEQKALPLAENEGASAYSDYNKNHRDVTGLCYRSLGELAKIIMNCLDEPACYYRQINGEQAMSRLSELCKKGIIEKAGLKKKLLVQLNEYEVTRPHI